VSTGYFGDQSFSQITCTVAVNHIRTKRLDMEQTQNNTFALQSK